MLPAFLKFLSPAYRRRRDDVLSLRRISARRRGCALLQRLDRDTQKFAFKCSSVTVDGKERDVFKDPITDSGKQSRRGKLGLYRDFDDDKFRTRKDGGLANQLQAVFLNGRMIGNISFEAVRAAVRFQDEEK